MFSSRIRVFRLVLRSSRLSSSFPHLTNDTIVQQLKEQSRTDRQSRFVDVREVAVRAGNGGAGAVIFTSYMYREFCGPDGGDGGCGGHVIFKVVEGRSNLEHLHNSYVAKHGEKGRKRYQTGKSGEHKVVEVPRGTVISRIVTATGDESRLKLDVVADLSEVDDYFVAAYGGAGGRGNHYYLSSAVQAPRYAEDGGDGQQFRYLLELKSIADAGFVGFPNVGKSSLLRALSRASPKVSCFPFTTLRPHLGVVSVDDGPAEQRATIADLPGLVEGAHQNQGLGLQFLRHVERCKALLYILSSEEDMTSTLRILLAEIREYNPEMLKRDCCVIVNKWDLVGETVSKEVFDMRLESLREYLIKSNIGAKEVFVVSAETGHNIERLKRDLVFYLN